MIQPTPIGWLAEWSHIILWLLSKLKINYCKECRTNGSQRDIRLCGSRTVSGGRFRGPSKDGVEESDHEGGGGDASCDEEGFGASFADPLQDECADAQQGGDDTERDLDREQTAVADTEAYPGHVEPKGGGDVEEHFSCGVVSDQKHQAERKQCNGGQSHENDD